MTPPLPLSVTHANDPSDKAKTLALHKWYHHMPQAPLTETTSLIYHDPVYRYAQKASITTANAHTNIPYTMHECNLLSRQKLIIAQHYLCSYMQNKWLQTYEWGVLK